MALSPPQPGQVIRYAYLWWNEARLAREDATKDRPYGVVLTRVDKSGNTIAYVLPITHTPPLSDEDGIEIPGATKQRLRLDVERSWIITTELNQFVWPGPDLRPTASGEYRLSTGETYAPGARPGEEACTRQTTQNSSTD